MSKMNQNTLPKMSNLDYTSEYNISFVISNRRWFWSNLAETLSYIWCWLVFFQMARLTDHMEQLRDKKLLIIHPTADGNTWFKPSFLCFSFICFTATGLCVTFLSVHTEKVHFQHTAKLITHLINEKANYTLQVRADQPLIKALRYWLLHFWII